METSSRPLKHIILVGACYLDTILTVPHFPEEDTKLRATSLEVRRGGNCPNSVEVLQQLLRHSSTSEATLVRPHLVTVLPATESPASYRIRSSFGQDTLVDFSHCLYREGHTEPASCYIIQSQAAGTRTIVNHSDLPDMTVEEFKEIADRLVQASTTTAGCKTEETLWHFEGRLPETTIECVRYLRRVLPKCRISVEVENPNRVGLRELAAEADIVFYSRIWAESQGYASADDCLLGEMPAEASLVFCTWGAQGASALSLPGKLSVRCAVGQTEPARKVVDTVGAGDTFIAGALFGLMCHSADWRPEETLRFAVDLASRKVQVNGFAELLAAGVLDGQGLLSLPGW